MDEPPRGTSQDIIKKIRVFDLVAREGDSARPSQGSSEVGHVHFFVNEHGRDIAVRV